MPKFLWQASYSPQGVQGLQKDGGTGRRAAVQKLVEQAGGKLDAFYYALGESDVYVITDLPDVTTAAAISLAVNATGAVRLSTVQLLTPEDVDKAMKKTVDYRPPGSAR
jgi:uncharacterized protein with GYD domain